MGYVDIEVLVMQLQAKDNVRKSQITFAGSPAINIRMIWGMSCNLADGVKGRVDEAALSSDSGIWRVVDPVIS
jgi:hypothetical protein